MVHTSHAGLYSIAGIIASTSLANVCGHAVDLSGIDYAGIGGSLIAVFLDMYKRRKVTP